MKRHYPEKPFGTPNRARTRSAWLLALVLVCAAGVRFLELGVASFWLDEAMSLHESENLPAIFIERGNAMGYSLLLHLLRLIVGDSTLWLRAFSAAAGMAAVWLCWRLTLRLTASGPAAFVAAGLLAMHPFVVQSARETRTYSLWIVIFLLTLEALTRAREDKPPVRLYWVASIALVLFHNFGVFYLLGQAVFLWRDTEGTARQKAGKCARWFAPLGILGLALFLRLLRKAGGVFDYLARWGAEYPGQPDAVERIGTQWLPFNPLTEFHGAYIVGVGAILLWWVLLRLTANDAALRRFSSLAIWSAVVPFGALYTLSLRIHERILLPATVIFCILFGVCAFGRRKSRGAISFALGCIALLSVCLWMPKTRELIYGEREDWRQVCKLLAQQHVQDEEVLVVPGHIRYPLKQCYQAGFRSPESIQMHDTKAQQLWVVESLVYNGSRKWDVADFYKRKLQNAYEMKESTEVPVGNLKVTRLVRRAASDPEPRGGLNHLD